MAAGRHSWIFTEMNFEVISVSGTFDLVSKPNFVWMCATATELWRLKWIFKIAAVAILGFFGSEIWRQWKSRRMTCIHLHTKFGEDTLKGCWVMAIYVFSKWGPAAILHFCRSEIWRYFCFRDVGFSLSAKFCVNICNNDWVMAVEVNFQNGCRRYVGFCLKWNLTPGPVSAYPYLSPYQIWWRYIEGWPSYDDLCVFKMAAGRHLGFSEKWNLKVFLFPGCRFFSLSQILCKCIQ